MELASLAIRISRSENLSALPQLMLSIIRKMGEPNVALLDLEELFQKDPAVTGKLLRAANSSYYSLKRPVTSVGAAIGVLGMRSVQSMVVSVAYQQALSADPFSKLLNRSAYWKHSLAAGVAVKSLLLRRAPELAEEGYMIGLMHDIGILGLDRHCPAELDIAINAARKGAEPSLSAALEHILGFDEMDVGGVLAEKWRMSKPMIASLTEFNSPLDGEDHKVMKCAVVLANALAIRAGFPNQIPDETAEVDPSLIFALEIEASVAEEVQSELASEVAAACDAFGVN